MTSFQYHQLVISPVLEPLGIAGKRQLSGSGSKTHSRICQNTICDAKGWAWLTLGKGLKNSVTPPKPTSDM